MFRGRHKEGPLSARWFQHKIGVQPDEPAFRLLPLLPGVSPLVVNLVFGPMYFAIRISSFVPPVFRYPFEGRITLQNQASARQTFYDSVVDRYISGMKQFVILGAGFDTRAVRLPTAIHIRSFEIDSPQTLDNKRLLLEQAGISLAGVVLVGADFAKDDWFTRLIEMGFDISKPALFLWEGVTPYLDRATVEETLRKVAGSARGSIIAFDYFTTEVLESQAITFQVVRKSLQAGGEPLKFGIDSTPPLRERVIELLDTCDLVLVEQQTVGQEIDRKRALGGFAITVVK